MVLWAGSTVGPLEAAHGASAPDSGCKRAMTLSGRWADLQGSKSKNFVGGKIADTAGGVEWAGLSGVHRPWGCLGGQTRKGRPMCEEGAEQA